VTDGRRGLLLLLAAGLLVRLALSAIAPAGFDIENLRVTGDALRAFGVHVYAHLNPASSATPETTTQFPYPPGFFPWVLVASHVSWGARSFAFVERLAPIAADLSIAVLVWAGLRMRGIGSRARLAGAAVIALGPTFIVTSADAGQLDAVAIAPALLALLLWKRDIPRRALVAGALIGIGAAVKTVPIALLIALLPSVRSRREAVILVGAAFTVPALTLAPFLIAAPAAVRRALDYSGFPGSGGLTLLVQPGLARHYLGDYGFDLNTAARALSDNSGLISGAAVACLGVLLVRRRVEPFTAAALLWLVIYVSAAHWYLQYLVWGLPFFVLAGATVQSAALQAIALLPALIEHEHQKPWGTIFDGPTRLSAHPDLRAALFAMALDLLWLGFMVALVVAVRATTRPGTSAAGRVP
jgi:hypothetical protein